MLFMSGLVVGACSDVFAYAQQAIDVSGLSENQVATVDVSKPDRAGKTFIAATIINAPIQKLCSIILDYPNYPNFMPNTDKTKARSSER